MSRPRSIPRPSARAAACERRAQGLRNRDSPRPAPRPSRRLLALTLLPALFAPLPAPAQPATLDLQSPSFAERAREIPAAGTMRLRGLSLGPGAPEVELALERFEIFSPDARVTVRGEGGGWTEPAPANGYFRGVVEGEPGSRALLTVRRGGGVRGLVIDAAGDTWILGGGPAAGGPAAGVASRRLEGGELAAQAAAFACDAGPLEEGAEELAAAGAPEPAVRDAVPQAPPPAAASGGDGYVATVAVETDHEFFQLFGNAADAADYVGDLFAYVSALYEGEVGTRLEVGSISLWTTAGDPWSQTSTSCGLYEFGRYWNDNRGHVGRTLAHFLSGRGNGGVAWVGALCLGGFNVDLGGACPALTPRVDNYGGDYGYSAGLSGSFDLQNPGFVWDVFVVAHEIGHNFNSRHTHCYAGVGGNPDPVDACTVSQCGSTGCACGSSALPAGCPGPGQGCGTVMSYCSQQSGGFGNVAWTLGAGHAYGVEPGRVPSRMSDHVAQRAASYPGCLAPANSAPTAGGDAYAVWEDLELEVAAPGVLANDEDPDGDPLTAVLVTTTASGSLTLAADGSFVYAPDPGFAGVDSFQYRAGDGELESQTATVTIDVEVCTGDPDLQLSGQTVTSVESHSACRSITAGPDFLVAGSGDLTLEAGEEIVLGDGFSVDSGATLEVRHSAP